MGSENQELLQIVTAMAENVGDVAESAEATRRASAGLSASAARIGGERRGYRICGRQGG